MKKIIFLLLIFLIICTGRSYAALGVGVGVGKIQVDQVLKPGETYNLPSITVLNTGDMPSEYQVVIEHQEKQPQLIPQNTWFTFSPQTFHLDPQKVQTVKIALNLPIKTVPGNYFAYLEAQPVKVDTNGITAVNIAAATKLYFTVVPGSIWEGLYYKMLSLWRVFSPWPQIILIGVILLLLVIQLRKVIHVEIKKPKSSLPPWIIVFFVAVFLILYFVFWMNYFR